MGTDRQLEIYRQRYETFRFHYRLEWQMLQAGVAIGLVTLGLGEKAFDPKWWQFLISGSVFLTFSYAMHRMAKGNREHRPIWMHYARVVGDPTVAEIGSPWKSAAVQARVVLFLAGLILIGVGVWKDNFNPKWLQKPITGIELVILALVADSMANAGKRNPRTLTHFRAQLGDWIVQKTVPRLERGAPWLFWLVFIGGVLLIVKVIILGVYSHFK